MAEKTQEEQAVLDAARIVFEHDWRTKPRGPRFGGTQTEAEENLALAVQALIESEA